MTRFGIEFVAKVRALMDHVLACRVNVGRQQQPNGDQRSLIVYNLGHSLVGRIQPCVGHLLPAGATDDPQ